MQLMAKVMRQRPSSLGGRSGWYGIGLLLAIGALSGCALGPRLVLPAVESDEFMAARAAEPASTLADLPWWELFADAILRDLIQTALTNNYDLRMAIQRVEQSRALRAQAGAQFWPQADYGGVLERSRNAFGGQATPGSGQTGSPVLLAASVAWELDLWGRVRRLHEVAQAQWLATAEARRGVTLLLVCNVAQTYYELLELDLELEIAQRTTLAFKESLDIFSQKLAAGTASRLETARAEAALTMISALIPELERQIVIKENQLNLLLARNLGPVPRAQSRLLLEAPPPVSAGLPADLLRQRPDIRQAEQQLRAANAQIGLAIAQCFPRIGLTALFGRVSTELEDFNADAQAWSLGGNLTGPLFQGGALLAQVRQARAHSAEAALAYEAAVRAAFRDVANALVTRAKLEEIYVQQRRCVECYQEAVSVARDRYLAGKASYYEVLETQQQLFPAENNLVRTQLYRQLAFIQLYKALGGGWNLPDDQWSAVSAERDPVATRIQR